MSSALSRNLKESLLLVQQLQTYEYSTKSELYQVLERADLNLNERTFERRMGDLRDEFGLEIKYFRGKGYKLLEQSNETLKYIELMKMLQRTGLMVETLKDAKSMLKLIDFEKIENSAFSDFLLECVLAIRNKQELEFSYKKFYRDETEFFRIQPYVLKQYLGRWYVIGLNTVKKQIRTYALDRLQSLDRLSVTFKESKAFEVMQQLDKIVGVNYSSEKVQRVVVRFSAFQANYQETQPLHVTQRVINRSASHVDFEWMLVPNYEFQQRLMMLGSEVEVIEPQWLRKEFSDRFNQLSAKYQR